MQAAEIAYVDAEWCVCAREEKEGGSMNRHYYLGALWMNAYIWA